MPNSKLAASNSVLTKSTRSANGVVSSEVAPCWKPAAGFESCPNPLENALPEAVPNADGVAAGAELPNGDAVFVVVVVGVDPNALEFPNGDAVELLVAFAPNEPKGLAEVTAVDDVWLALPKALNADAGAAAGC